MKRTKMPAPKRDYSIKVQDSKNVDFINRLLCATPTTGLIRMEWASARFGQIIPCNWSYVTAQQFMSPFLPYRYSVPDAQNLVVGGLVKDDFQWMMFIEQDTCPPPDAFIRFNEYMMEGKVPVISGLYYTKSRPSEPIVYRGRGNSYYDKFKLGDLVWCDGVPMGCILIHGEILKKMWQESPEYRTPDGFLTRRVFETPARNWKAPTGESCSVVGTSDLDWCARVMRGNFFAKAGWPEYQKKKFPFLVDTNIFCTHIDNNGETYP